ncbi:MAG: cyclic 2,3-diphosphoglycerate synthase [Candidatus Binatia bacterium]
MDEEQKLVTVERVIIMGAAGRDFHVFNTYFRLNPAYEVVAFTATQIPGIANRHYPPELSGPRYIAGIPIRAEPELERLISDERVDQVVFAYSDVSHETVMHAASRVLSAGADFRIVGPQHSSLVAERPVISVCAIRTGSGKGMVVRYLSALLRARGIKPVVVRHPMPYGELVKQAVQRFAAVEDCDRHACTIEEREEYEQHIRDGVVVYAGVDYERILRAAEQEADIILWDGGNNDWPFFRSDLEIVVVDPHRAGHELRYHPGETNLRRAQVLVVNKIDSAPVEGIQQVLRNIAVVNPQATVIQARSQVIVDHPDLLRGKRVLVIEDGPTLTHGEMAYGAGVIAAQRCGAAEIIDPRPMAQGSLVETFAQYPWITHALPAMGYSNQQMLDLAATINAIECDTIVVATPVDLRRLLILPQPSAYVRYDLEEISHPRLSDLLDRFIYEQLGDARNQ